MRLVLQEPNFGSDEGSALVGEGVVTTELRELVATVGRVHLAAHRAVDLVPARVAQHVVARQADDTLLFPHAFSFPSVMARFQASTHLKSNHKAMERLRIIS